LFPKIILALRYFIQIAFNGSEYHGWQRQPNAYSVQQALEDALGTLLASEIAIVGAGRTDAGVHAEQIYAHFDYEEHLDLIDLTHKLNRFLFQNIAILDIRKVNSQAHARFDATSRSYRYLIETRKNPFNFNFSHYVGLPLDLEQMNRAAQYLVGRKDFECFSRTHTDVKTFICDVKTASFTKEGSLIRFEITADRFLRNMVRAIVGSLLEVGLGKRSPEWIDELIESKSRSRAGASAPAKGLSLVAVNYPNSIWNE
jgi:tRNA pseudouridine38-40 synthase